MVQYCSWHRPLHIIGKLEIPLHIILENEEDSVCVTDWLSIWIIATSKYTISMVNHISHYIIFETVGYGNLCFKFNPNFCGVSYLLSIVNGTFNAEFRFQKWLHYHFSHLLFGRDYENVPTTLLQLFLLSRTSAMRRWESSSSRLNWWDPVWWEGRPDDFLVALDYTLLAHLQWGPQRHFQLGSCCHHQQQHGFCPAQPVCNRQFF